MIDVRKVAGIHNQSSYTNTASNKDYYVVTVTGMNGQLMAVVGTKAGSYAPTNQNFVKVLSGYHYAYFLKNDMNVAWVDLASGAYEGARKATLTAVCTDSSAKLVYTTDGSDPTANSRQVTSGTQIDIPVGKTTLKVGLLMGQLTLRARCSPILRNPHRGVTKSTYGFGKREKMVRTTLAWLGRVWLPQKLVS